MCIIMITLLIKLLLPPDVIRHMSVPVLVRMCLLLVVIFLFSSSSCSVSSHQYYVSDNCSSVTYTPCHPLSAYARNISQYNNTIFYFIGESVIYHGISMHFINNITLHGLDHSPYINCSRSRFTISKSSHIFFFNISMYECDLCLYHSNNITITGVKFSCASVDFCFFVINTFDFKVLASTLIGFSRDYILVTFQTLSRCSSSELPHYTMNWTNVTFYGSLMWLELFHGMSYNLIIILDQINSVEQGGVELYFSDSLFSFAIINSSMYHYLPAGLGLFYFRKSVCHFPIAQPLSSIAIENIHFFDNFNAALVISAYSSMTKQPIIVSIKSCVIQESGYGLKIDATFMPFLTINISDTELTSNRGNLITNCYSVLLNNVTIANSRSAGITLKGSVVTVNNSLILRNNTGVSGGGIAITDQTYIAVLPQASFQFINNHATYKGGGIFSANNDPFQYANPPGNSKPIIPIAFWNNTAGTSGDDIYGFVIYDSQVSFSYNNSYIRSSTDPVKICFCYLGNSSCLNTSSVQHIFPGQKLKYNVALFGYNASRTSYSLTDGVVVIKVDDVKVYTYNFSSAHCSTIEYSPNQTTTTRHNITLLIQNCCHLFTHFTIHECPIGFSIDSSQDVCTCSQSVSRENVTCDIVSFNITHNGLLWIGTNDTSTPFNANQTNPNACIINEDCLLYCSPNPVTFKMNDTDPQCVDDRGQVMCGSCRDGYSLLMGSNKCGHCDNDYTIIVWIALFAVMGILLVAVLIALNLTVSVGTLNGLLFYANIVKLYGPVFSRKGALPVLSQVISWINLDFGIEACFYNFMDSYAKQWLQFVFPLYLWMIIIVIIWLCRRYGKISRLMGSHAVPVLSTLFLLSYTKLVRTIVIVLHKRDITLHCINGSMISVSKWYEDPNVDYAKGKHAGLFAFALFVSFIFVIPYTLFLSFSPLFEKYLSNYKVFKKLWSQFKPIIDAYSGPMKDEYRFWPGLLLVARLPILLSVTLVDSFIESHYFLLCMLLTVLAVVLSLGHCFGGLYRKRMNNNIEVWFLFNLCIMVGLSGAYNNDGCSVMIWYNTCLSVFTASFVAIIVYHLYLQLSHMKCYDALMKKLFKKQQDEDDDPLLDVNFSHKTVDQQRKEIVPSSTVVNMDRRESVAELFEGNNN